MGSTWGARPFPGSPHPLARALPLPSVLAHQVPNAKKLRRKEQLWERLAKQGELPREVRRAQARLRSPPAAKARPGPPDTAERPFYDLWASDSECAVTWGRAVSWGRAVTWGGLSPGGGRRAAAQAHTVLMSKGCPVGVSHPLWQGLEVAP